MLLEIKNLLAEAAHLSADHNPKPQKAIVTTRLAFNGMIAVNTERPKNDGKRDKYE